MQHFDVIVIGSGPGGEGASMKAAKEGKSVAMVEGFHEVGGGCTRWATIPSKALRQVVIRLMDFRNNPLVSHLTEDLEISFPRLMQTAEKVIRSQVKLRANFYERNRVKIFHGNASFVDAHTLAVTGVHEGAKTEHLHGNGFVIATGSRPYRPADVDFNHPRIRDSDTILTMQETPKTLTVYGAGVVGCEYASMIRNMGIKVNLVNTRDKLLSFLDDEIADALAYHLRDQGVLIRQEEEAQQVEAFDDGVVLHLKSGKKIKSDVLLWANGRTGNSQGMGLEALGIAPNDRGQIPINEHYQTSQKHIYAVGDVVGFPSLASAAYDQGRFASTHLIEGHCDQRLVQDIPTGIYTNPEISSLGKTERELTEAKVPYEVGHSLFRSLARAQITGQTVGMLKLLFHRETLEILGIHCFGAEAAEIIHIGQAIFSQRGPANTLMYFINTTFNYPTMAEAYRVAALNGLNRLF